MKKPNEDWRDKLIPVRHVKSHCAWCGRKILVVFKKLPRDRANYILLYDDEETPLVELKNGTAKTTHGKHMVHRCSLRLPSFLCNACPHDCEGEIHQFEGHPYICNGVHHHIA